MSKKPRLGGTVQISGKQYTVLVAPYRRTKSFWIMVSAKSGLRYWARSEGWRLGCGPWQIESEIDNAKEA